MGTKRETYIGRRISELGLDMEQYLKTFTEVLRSDGFIERDSFYEISKRWIHSILYTTRPDEVISLFSDTTEMRNAHEALFNSEKCCAIFSTTSRSGWSFMTKRAAWSTSTPKPRHLRHRGEGGCAGDQFLREPDRARGDPPQRAQRAGAVLQARLSFRPAGRLLSLPQERQRADIYQGDHAVRHVRRTGQLPGAEYRQHRDQRSPPQTGGVRKFVLAGEPLRQGGVRPLRPGDPRRVCRAAMVPATWARRATPP